MGDAPKVLVVDDDEFVYLAVSHIFEKIGYEVLSASNGRLALTLAEKHLPRCIFLDIQMPGMDGYEVCSRIRSTPSTAQTPVIFVSAKDVSKGFDQEIAAGGNFFVSKPFMPDDLAVDLYYLNELNFNPTRPEVAKLRVAKPLARKESPPAAKAPAAPPPETTEALSHEESELRQKARGDGLDRDSGEQELRDLRLLMLSNSYRLSGLIRILEAKGIIRKDEVDNVLRSIVDQETAHK